MLVQQKNFLYITYFAHKNSFINKPPRDFLDPKFPRNDFFKWFSTIPGSPDPHRPRWVSFGPREIRTDVKQETPSREEEMFEDAKWMGFKKTCCYAKKMRELCTPLDFNTSKKVQPLHSSKLAIPSSPQPLGTNSAGVWTSGMFKCLG